MTDRPSITHFSDPGSYIKEMIQYRKRTEPRFSVLAATSHLRRVSPALISLIIKGKRRVTLDRVDEMAKLLGLNSNEKTHFKNWLSHLETGSEALNTPPTSRNRSEAPVSLLSDWLNVYVKDLFQLKDVQKNPDLIYRKLAHVARPTRIEKSYRFLLEHGYLRRTLNGEVVLNTNLSVTDPGVPSQKIRQFHKAALKIAQSSIDLFPPSERLANTLTVPINEDSYGELLGIVQEYTEKLLVFAEKQTSNGKTIYQLTINLCPIGGSDQ